MKQNSRRNFLQKSAKAGVATLIAMPSISSAMAAVGNGKNYTTNHAKLFATGFDQQPLAYAYAALEPSIDTTTMDIHYNKHAATYSKNVKEAAAAEKVDMTKPLEEVLFKISSYSVKMRNNAGGHYNHELFWKCLTPTNTQPSGKLLAAIEKDFGSLDGLKKQLSEAAKNRFGSGWAWLVATADKKLIVSSTPNQDNPLMDIAEVKGFPLFGLDVWEHAYYLKYQNRRADYIDSFWKVLNWNYVNERFSSL
jgi:Fe-Mn family superoxide dismutase